jgi:hypothetical protein
MLSYDLFLPQPAFGVAIPRASPTIAYPGKFVTMLLGCGGTSLDQAITPLEDHYRTFFTLVLPPRRAVPTRSPSSRCFEFMKNRQQELYGTFFL